MLPNLRALAALLFFSLAGCGCGVQVMVARQAPPAPPRTEQPAQPADAPPERATDVSRE